MPTTTVNIHQAKTHLSRLVDQAASGHDIIIAKAGKPVARLLPLSPVPEQRQLGGMAGRGVIPDGIKAGFEADMAGMFHPGA